VLLLLLLLLLRLLLLYMIAGPCKHLLQVQHTWADHDISIHAVAILQQNQQKQQAPKQGIRQAGDK
jgi:hypothetical protein